jgi:transposase
MWIPPETKVPILLHKPTRKSVGYFGSVRLRDGKFTYRPEEEKFNAETFQVFLRQLRSISSHAARKAIVILDNARYHHANLHKEWRKQKTTEFQMLYLPPYSPELNPVERVWKMTRRMATHNKYFHSLDDVKIAVETLFQKWRSPNELLRKLCAIK